MIVFLTGNLFESEAQALVNTVNCVGVMGKGIAYQFSRAYPLMFKEYERQCARQEIQLGKVVAFEEKGKTIINFPTKGHWRAHSRIEDIENGLRSLHDLICERAIQSIAIPPLGCGNGGLEWKDVRRLIEQHLSDLDKVRIFVYEPVGHFTSKVAQKPKLSLSHFILAALRAELATKSKLVLQKSAYFFNVLVEPGYFQFAAHKFGPYNIAIDPMVREITAYLDYTGLSVQEMLAQGIRHELEGKKADHLREWLPAIRDVAGLCNRNTAHLEAMATVHAVIVGCGTGSEDEIQRKFFEWSKEKSERFTPEDVERAIARLEDEGLIVRTLFGYQQTQRRINPAEPAESITVSVPKTLLSKLDEYCESARLSRDKALTDALHLLLRDIDGFKR